MMSSCKYSSKVLAKARARRDRDAKGFDAGLQALQKAALEDPDQGLLAAQFELVLLFVRAFVGFQVVVRQVQRLDAPHDVLVEPS